MPHERGAEVKTTNEDNSERREERGLAQDAGAAFVVGATGAAEVVAGKAAAQSVIDKVSGVLGKKEPPSKIVLPPGTGD
jgi:hypothetical protein